MELCFNTLRKVLEMKQKEFNRKQFAIMTPIEYYISSELFIEIWKVLIIYINSIPIIHRDLKPTNILITNGLNGRFVKIADFGLSKIHEIEDQTHTKYVGTVKYIAPEVQQTKQLRHKSRYL